MLKWMSKRSISELSAEEWVAWREAGEGHATLWHSYSPRVPQALGDSDLMLLSIIIFTNSTAIEPGSSAIIIMLSLLLIILIISINYKQKRGTVGGSRGRKTSGRVCGG